MNVTASGPKKTSRLAQGSRLKNGAYKIEKYLAHGGFGVTYKAWDEFGRTVVVKECFPAGLATRGNASFVTASAEDDVGTFQKCVRLFLKESETLRLMRSPHIVSVKDAFEENGTAYMVMTFIDGPEFQAVINKAPDTLTQDYLLNFAVQLLKAVQVVHAAEILHRDIKPGNILIDPNERPVLIDFGAARVEATQQSATLTQSLRVVADGFSPNEFYVRDVMHSAASDLYSVAATLWSAIERRQPPSAPERTQAIADSKPDPLTKLSDRHPEFDPIFLESIDKTLQLARRDRIQSAEDWLDLLKPLYDPVLISPIMPVIAEAETKRPLKSLFIGTLTGAATVAGLVVASDDIASALGRGSASFPPDIMGLQDNVADLRTENRVLEREIRRAAEAVSSRDERLSTLTGRLDSANSQVALLEAEAAVLRDAGIDLQRQLDLAEANTSLIQRRVIRLETQISAFEREAQTLEAEINTRDETISTLRSDSAEGNSIVVDLRREIDRLTTERAEVQQQLAQVRENNNVANTSFLSSQNDLAELRQQLRQANDAVEDRDRQIAALSARPALLGQTPQTLTSPSLTPNVQAGLRAWQSAQIQTISLSEHTAALTDLAFSPDARRLITTSIDNTAQAWDTATGDRLRVLRETNRDLRSVDFSRTGDIFATIGDHPDIQVWNNNNLSVSRRIEIGGTTGSAIAISPSRDFIAGGLVNGTVRIWDQNGNILNQISGHSDEVSAIAFSADGRFMATGAYDQTVKIWQMPELLELQSINDHNAWVRTISFSPDGRQLLSVDFANQAVMSSQNGGQWRTITSQPLVGREVSAAAFLPSGDGLIIGTPRPDLSVAVTDLNLQSTRQLGRHSAEIVNLDVATNGQQIASASEDGTSQIFALNNQ